MIACACTVHGYRFGCWGTTLTRPLFMTYGHVPPISMWPSLIMAAPTRKGRQKSFMNTKLPDYDTKYRIRNTENMRGLMIVSRKRRICLNLLGRLELLIILIRSWNILLLL